MKSTALLTLPLFCALASAQSNQEKFEAKLEKEFVSAVPWVQSLDEATATARESGKLIFAYFTRSYSP